MVHVGSSIGFWVGPIVGSSDGNKEGCPVGANVGWLVGTNDGEKVGVSKKQKLWNNYNCAVKFEDSEEIIAMT